jgi:hypothetical protein
VPLISPMSQKRVTPITLKPEARQDNFDMRMTGGLIIGYDGHHFPIGAVCFACGAGMPRPDPTLTRSEDVAAWFDKEFALHLEKKHKSPDESLRV